MPGDSQVAPSLSHEPAGAERPAVSQDSLNASPEAVSEATASMLLDPGVFESAGEPATKDAADEPASDQASEQPGATPEMPSMVPEMDPDDASATGMLKLEDLDAKYAETIFGEDASAAASDAVAAKPEVRS